LIIEAISNVFSLVLPIAPYVTVIIEGDKDISFGKRSSSSLMPLSVFGGNNSKDIEGELPAYISENLIAKN
tara:strand:- start:438 stop:650 length:213 start_codon:yes stop_codon:yes gene_type:complete